MAASRYAAKTIIAKRDPRAAFLVDGGAKAVLLRGSLEVFDPLSLSSDGRAVLEGPGYFLGMAGYARRYAPFFLGNPPTTPKLSRATSPIHPVGLPPYVTPGCIVQSSPSSSVA